VNGKRVGQLLGRVPSPRAPHGIRKNRILQ
jgi:hypothetical protein